MFNIVAQPFRDFRFAILLLLLIPSLTGCVIHLGGGDDAPPIDPANKEVSMIYGYLDMQDAPSGVSWVKMKRFQPLPQHEYYCGVKDGLFWHVGIEKGAYQVETFGKEAGFFSNTNYKYNFGTSGRNQTARQIKKPGLYFLGAYKYKGHKAAKWYLPDQFEMQAIQRPTQLELLQRLLKEMQTDKELKVYTRQISWIEAEIKRLSKGKK